MKARVKADKQGIENLKNTFSNESELTEYFNVLVGKRIGKYDMELYSESVIDKPITSIIVNNDTNTDIIAVRGDSTNTGKLFINCNQLYDISVNNDYEYITTIVFTQKIGTRYIDYEIIAYHKSESL